MKKTDPFPPYLDRLLSRFIFRVHQIILPLKSLFPLISLCKNRACELDEAKMSTTALFSTSVTMISYIMDRHILVVHTIYYL